MSSTSAIFWRGVLNNAGPALGFTEEKVQELSDEEVVSVGENFVRGFEPLFDAFGRLAGHGVLAYRDAVSGRPGSDPREVEDA